MVLTTTLIEIICVGLPKDHWKVAQQNGRAGRDGRQSASVTLLWPGQKGNLHFNMLFVIGYTD